MNRLACRAGTTAHRGGPCRNRAMLVFALGWLLAAPSAPAHADLFPGTLLVNGGSGPVELEKHPGALVRLEWNLPPVAPADRNWQLRVGSRALECTADDAAALIAGAGFHLRTSAPLRSGFDLDLSGPNFPSGARYFVRMCLPLDTVSRRPGGERHETNQVEINLILGTIVGARITTPLPGTPWITSTLAATPVRSRYWIGVVGRNFGERPGRLLLQLSPTDTRELSDLDWHSGSIAGRVPFIDSRPDGPAFLIVEPADGGRSNRESVNYVAKREVRLLPPGAVHIDSCSQEADVNHCYSPPEPGTHTPSFTGSHSSYLTSGESGVDRFSVTLANGWRFHELVWSHGLDEDGPPALGWRVYDSETDHPSFSVSWNNPTGWNQRFYYGFQVFIIGPGGVPPL